MLFLEPVMRGYNIVADGWAGVSNPHPHPKATPPHSQPNTSIYNARFTTFRLVLTDGRTDGWTGGRKKPLIELRVRN